MTSVISIIIPVYNVEKYIRRCLDSISNQDFTEWECILIDDGSNDNSGKTCDEYSKLDNRFKVIHQTNKGVSAARNAGLDSAKGEWITFVDSDDWVEDCYLSELFSNVNGADFVICNNIIDEYKKKTVIKHFNVPQLKEELLGAFPTHNHFLGTPWNKLFRTSIIKNNNLLFPTNIKYNEDLLFTFQYCYYSSSFKSVNSNLYHYNHQNETSTTNNIDLSTFSDKCFVIDTINKLLSTTEHSNTFDKIIYEFKLSAKLLIINHKKIQNKQLWIKTYPEVDSYIWKSSLRIDFKILMWLCKIRLFKLSFLLNNSKRRLYGFIFFI